MEASTSTLKVFPFIFSVYFAIMECFKLESVAVESVESQSAWFLRLTNSRLNIEFILQANHAKMRVFSRPGVIQITVLSTNIPDPGLFP